MANFISHVHNEIRRALLTRRGATHHPDNVPRGTHKAYSRMEQLPLPAPDMIRKSLSETLEERMSYFGGTANAAFTIQEWGTLLGLALKKHPNSYRRNYPSGGALYPVETYIFGKVTPETPQMVFHYNPTEHALEKLWDLPDGFDLKTLARKPDDLFFTTIIVFTSSWKRSSAKYGDLAYSHALLEAGHMSENILLVSTALGLKSRPIAGFSDDVISDLLDLDPLEEQPVHSIVLTK